MITGTEPAIFLCVQPNTLSVRVDDELCKNRTEFNPISSLPATNALRYFLRLKHAQLVGSDGDVRVLSLSLVNILYAPICRNVCIRNPKINMFSHSLRTHKFIVIMDIKRVHDHFRT